MTSIFIIAFLIYAGLTIAFGCYMARNQSTGSQFLFADKSLPLFLTLGTTIATMVGTGSSMGAVGKGYLAGWAGSLYGIGGAFGIVLLAALFAPVRKFQFSTMADEFAHYTHNSPQVRKIVSFFILLSSIGWLGAHILGGAKYLELVSGWNPVLAKSIIAIAFGTYVIIGGYRAVVWTDSLQAIVLFTGFISVAVLVIINTGGWAGIQAANQATLEAHGAPPVLHSLSLMLSIAVGVLGTPSYRQRLYTAKDEGVVRRAFYFSGGLYAAFAILPAIIGIGAWQAHPGLESADHAFPYMAMNVLPVWAGLVVILAGMSATMSSASSDAVAGTSSWIRDILPKLRKKPLGDREELTHSRIGLGVMILAALGMALAYDGIIDYITSMIGILMGGMCVAGILGRFWKRFSASGMISSIVGGSLMALTVELIPAWKAYWGNPIIPCVLFSILIGIVFSSMARDKSDAEAQNNG